ncbi:uncharacterized protein LOC130725061 [Lotus japonicus]|uniref:uncharacterized protein LOC130725061 n=1 Tax=Lotus japonicus TaxID=34305 RepID=UPI00258D1C72|nr:uncharacterized protein LOC130725061 [Lotus japonicus]
MEVYVDDMIVKSAKSGDHDDDLKEAFAQLRKYRMKLNPEKCSFGIQGVKFLGFMITSRGIEVNPDKGRAILEMKSPTNVKEVQRLTGRMAALARFLPMAGDKATPFFTCLKKNSKFQWTEACEQAFTKLKESLATLPVLSKPTPVVPLTLYLAVTDRAVSTVLLQEEGKKQKVKGEYQVKDPQLSKYLEVVHRLMMEIEKIRIEHVPRSQNERADVLAKLASTGRLGNYQTVIQETLPRPSIDLVEVKLKEVKSVIEGEPSWMESIKTFLKNPPKDDDLNTKEKRREASFYTLVDGELYRRGIMSPVLKCVDTRDALGIMTEVHEGVCSSHIGGRSLAVKKRKQWRLLQPPKSGTFYGDE